MQKSEIIEKLKNIDDIPTLPVVALNVNKMLEDKNISINTLAQTIENDPAIVAKLLRLVNSPFYGFSSKIDSISRSVVVLGFDAVRNAVLSVCVVDALAGEADSGFDMEKFWEHSISVAVTSKYLAQHSRLAPSDQCFVAGILHDIGKVITVRHFPELYAEIRRGIEEEGLRYSAAERAVMGCDHGCIGGYLARTWHIPDHLSNAIEYHHEPKPEMEGSQIALVVNMADALVTSQSIDRNRVDCNARCRRDVSDLAFAALRKHLADGSDWAPQLAAEIEQACRFFLEE